MLFKTVAEIKAFAQPNGSMNFASLKPAIHAAEQRYIIPAISQALYDDLDMTYNIDQEGMPEKMKILLRLVQQALANLALYLYSPMAEVQIDDAGIRRAEDTNLKTAYKYQVQALREVLLDAGMDGLERALLYLERERATFTSWAGSPERLLMNSLLVRTASDMKLHFSNLRQPQRTYLAVASMMRTIEDITVAPIIGPTFRELKAAQAAGDMSPEQAELAQLLKKAIVQLTMAAATLELQLRIDDNGISLLSQGADISRGDDGKRQAADSRRVSQLADQCQKVGQEYLKLATAFLDQHAGPDLFPAWYADLQLKAQAAEPLFINDQLKGSFYL